MKNEELFNESHEATYCPEDNKIRLYVGRVDRQDFLDLRAEGWTSTPKQDCDFVATWTADREDTALSYAGYLGDEDQGPAERAVDRAERFAGYRDKRTGEAFSYAGSYDNGPRVHGRQDYGQAVKSADRHDRLADRALTQWSKAEYWTTRTAGVISNALYLSRPEVRMGRIKKLETEARRLSNREDERGKRWFEHYQNRLAYENQMLEAVGGRASVVEMEKGGLYGGYVISRVVKSKASGNATSVKVIAGDKEILCNIEREKAGQYEAPTEESLIALKDFLKARAAKVKAENAGKPKLINPTNEDALRLQTLWNKNATEQCLKGTYSNGRDRTEPQTVLEMTQAQYSARSGGSYSSSGTIFLSAGGVETRRHYYETVRSEAVCKIRKTHGTGNHTGNAHRVIVITDKPQNPLPASVWEKAKETVKA